MTTQQKRLLQILLATLFLVVLSFGFQKYRIFFISNTAFETETKEVFIASNTPFDSLMIQLSPWLKRPADFVSAAKSKSYDVRVRSGHFILKKGLGNHELINILRSQNIPVRISFNNQHSLGLLCQRLAAQIEPDSTSLHRAFLDQDFLQSKNLTPDQVLGLFLPDTYEVYWNTTAEDFRDRMWASYEVFWNKTRRKLAQQKGLRPIEVMALAAIVQKETAMEDERPRVAGVYLNRLKRGMKLQADPTIIYCMQQQENYDGQPIRRVLYKDLKIDSPFNTYLNKGLPPGLIAMPDRSAITAVLNAENHRFLYFVADPSQPGYHAFAQTLGQHNRHKKAYLKWLARQNIKR